MWIGTGRLASTSAKGSQRHNALRRQSSLLSEKMHKFGVESVPSTRGHVVKKYEELHHMPFHAGVAPRTNAGLLHHRNRGWKCGTIKSHPRLAFGLFWFIMECKAAGARRFRLVS